MAYGPSNDRSTASTGLDLKLLNQPLKLALARPRSVIPERSSDVRGRRKNPLTGIVPAHRAVITCVTGAKGLVNIKLLSGR